MTSMLHGVDVSHYQSPKTLDYAGIARSSQFAMINANDGVTADKAFEEHWKRFTDKGVCCGPYVFFQHMYSPEAHIDVLARLLDRVNYDAGDIVPALDVETWGRHQINPDWSEPARKIAEELARLYGDVLIYISQYEWKLLGSPEWVLRHKLWVPHWKQRSPPATPGGAEWSLWQHKVGPYAPTFGPSVTGHPQAIDHNWCNPPLPVRKPEPDTLPDVAQLLPLELTEADWQAMRDERDRIVRGG